MGKARGALIADVTKTGPAEKAGVEPGDVVIEFNGKAINEMKDLPRIVADTAIGHERRGDHCPQGQGRNEEPHSSVGRLEDGEKVVAQQDSKSGTAPVPAVTTVLGMTVSSMTDDLRRKYSIDGET